MTDLFGKLALVTGASRGIGYHCALTLAKAGAHVVAVARTVGGLEELDDEIQSVGSSATLVPLDLLDFDGIDRLGASLHERWGKLDILVANAGMLGGLSPIEHIEPKTFEKILALNVTANWRLARSVSSLMRSSEYSRAVFLSSDLASSPKPFWGGYSVSQAALASLVETWALETEKTSLNVNMLDPGPMETALRAQAMPGEDKATLAHPREISDSLLLLCSNELQETGKTYRRQTSNFS